MGHFTENRSFFCSKMMIFTRLHMILFITHQLQHNTPRPCQTSRCSDLYDRYIPGYISTSASSAGDSSGQQHNRTNTIIEHQLIDYENNQIEKKIIASKGAELVSYLYRSKLMILQKSSYGRLALDKIIRWHIRSCTCI